MIFCSQPGSEVSVGEQNVSVTHVFCQDHFSLKRKLCRPRCRRWIVSIVDRKDFFRALEDESRLLSRDSIFCQVSIREINGVFEQGRIWKETREAQRQLIDVYSNCQSLRFPDMFSRPR